MNYRRGVFRLIVTGIFILLVTVATTIVGSVVTDDVAVEALNSAEANRVLVINEQTRGVRNVASFAIGGLLLVWSGIGFRTQKEVKE